LIESAGPDPQTDPAGVRLVVGVVAGGHGVHGELKVRPLTDDLEHFSQLREVYLGEEDRPRRIRGFRLHGGHVLLRLAGIVTPEAAALLRGAELRAPARALRPLEEGEFFLYQVIGLEVRTEDGVLLGSVVDLMETGASDVFVIARPDSKEQVLLPNRPEVVLSIDPAHGAMTVRPLEYLE
jgi:16S rRNA processing protein RimM